MKTMNLIFDLDGTLWDASREIARSWTDILQPDSPIVPDDIRAVAGLPMDAIFEKLGLPFEDDLYHALIEAEHQAIREDGAILFPGIREGLARLSQCYNLYIVSNCQQGYIELFLDRMNMSAYFQDHLCWGDTLTPKGQTIRTLMMRHGMSEATYIGDTRGDQTAAAQADIPFIFVNYGYGEAEEPVQRIDQFLDLLEVFPCP